MRRELRQSVFHREALGVVGGRCRVQYSIIQALSEPYLGYLGPTPLPTYADKGLNEICAVIYWDFSTCKAQGTSDLSTGY